MITRIHIIAGLVCAAIVMTPLGAEPPGAQEAARVRVLLVLDTLDQNGATWGLDGDNMKALLERAFTAQELTPGKHFTIDMFTDKKVTPRDVLDYYTKLKAGPNETLVFYYSGHGGYHANKGHYMALTIGHQRLYRREVLEAMAKHKPRLRVVLTDCCANLSEGAWADTEPGGVQVVARETTAGAGGARAQRKEPAAQLVQRPAKVAKTFIPPRFDPKAYWKPLAKAKQIEPPANVVANKTSEASPHKKATQAEPTVAALREGIQLRVGRQTVPLKDVLDKTDGAILRRLFFAHQGLVDINGCPKGLLSQGTLEWGGSLFTIALLMTQLEPAAKLDADQNGHVEWSEFFSHWRALTERISRQMTNVPQAPEAWHLNGKITKEQP